MQTFDFEYDDTDQLESASYPGGLQTFTYDDFDRLNTLSEFGFADLVKFDYDHQDRVTAIIYGYNNGVACYQYDADGRLTKVGRILTGQDSTACQSVDVEWTSYVYDAKGRLDTRTYHNGVRSYWDYALDTGQLREIGHTKADGTLIYSDTFIYVPGTNLYDKISRTDATGLKTTDYDYDAHQRLTSVTEADGRNTAYRYDAFGNRTYKTITIAEELVEQYRYVYAGNRLTDIFHTPATGIEDASALETFVYDNVGRIKTRTHKDNGLTTYTWDDRGYLIKLTKPGLNTSYTYNALGARTTKTVNGSLTKFVTAPVFGMNHVLMEADASNNITRRYVYGGHQQLIQEPSPGNKDNDHFLLHGGSVGNITHAISRNNGAIVINQYDYDAFGSRSTVAGNNSTNFGYSGEQYDEETGLLYLRARYYDPELGRFITVDPYLGRMDEPVTQNRYIYVHNNPLLFVDPSGLEKACSQLSGSCWDGTTSPETQAGLISGTANLYYGLDQSTAAWGWQGAAAQQEAQAVDRTINLLVDGVASAIGAEISYNIDNPSNLSFNTSSISFQNEDLSLVSDYPLDVLVSATSSAISDNTNYLVGKVVGSGAPGFIVGVAGGTATTVVGVYGSVSNSVSNGKTTLESAIGDYLGTDLQQYIGGCLR